MISEVDICNQALAAMGTRSTITSLLENSVEAKNCNMQYASTRDQLLRCAPWGFCKRTEVLALLKAAPGTPEFIGTVPTEWSNDLPPPPWLYSYAYPNDCVIVRFVQGTLLGQASSPIFPTNIGVASSIYGPPSKFEIRSEKVGSDSARTVVTNQQKAIATYNFLETNPTNFDSEFVIALINALAANLVIPLSGDKGLKDRLEKDAENIIAEARVRSANEELTIYDVTPDWILARGTSVVYPGLDLAQPFVWPNMFRP